MDDLFTDSNDDMPKERLTFQGTYSSENESGFFNESSRLHALEQEQEQLNSSLMALTTHFAKVQFRLKQVVSAPSEEKDRMLKELEEFAFRGCPNLNNPSILVDEFSSQKIISEQNIKQRELIEQLKLQLRDLESYTYEPGSSEIPSSVVMEKQKVIIDELSEKVDLSSKNLHTLSNDELRSAVDNAINRISYPAKVKEELVSQLKTQISDLERFIMFLQGDASSPGPYARTYTNFCSCNLSGEGSAFPVFSQPTKHSATCPHVKNSQASEVRNDENVSSIALLKRMLSIMQIFAITQLGCSNGAFEKNSLKKQSGNHWGDTRANLEISISKVLKLYGNLLDALHKNKLKFNSTHTTESDDEEQHLEEPPNELIRVVRKEFACALRDLMQHGLIEINRTSTMAPFGCFVVRSQTVQAQMHIWDLLMKYFDIKRGKEYTQSATNKLSQSFNLNVVSGKHITIKQSLLNAIDTVQRAHGYDTTNKDSCFKAFVCLALNEKKLVLYLKQLLKTAQIIENYYQSWSYVKSTGFDDALKSLDQLKIINTKFPVEKSLSRRAQKKGQN